MKTKRMKIKSKECHQTHSIKYAAVKEAPARKLIIPKKTSGFRSPQLSFLSILFSTIIN